MECPPSQLQVAFFYASLYLMAFAQGGHKPCVQAFGADQFDENDPAECMAKSSFFNWWLLGLSGSIIFAIMILSYVQDYIGWGMGFAIPCIAMTLALVVFLLGTKTYRFYPRLEEKKSPFTITSETLVATEEEQGERLQSIVGGHEEDARGLLRLLPTWATCLIYAVVTAQPTTLFTKQGSTMDRRIGSSNLQVPPAALQTFINISIFCFIPIYDRILVPVCRKFTKHPSGITMLQRVGTGMATSVVAMVIAALVETKRLRTAREFRLVDQPTATIPMSFWWLVPQYVLYGISDVFAVVGLQEFFYDQVPDAFRSLGLAIYLSIFGIGSFIGGFLVSVIDKTSSEFGESWFSNNLNRAHLDYFYWLLAGLSACGLLLYLRFAQAYQYKKRVSTVM